MATPVGQKIKTRLAAGVNSSGNPITFVVTNDNQNQTVNYIPKRILGAGKDYSTGKIYKIRLSDFGLVIY